MSAVTVVADALLRALRGMPLEGVSALVDALLLSSGLSSSSLLHHFIQNFSLFLKDNDEQQQCLDAQNERFLSAFIAAVTQLQVNAASDMSTLKELIWMVFIRSLKDSTYGNDVLRNQIVAALAEIATKKNAWGNIEAVLVTHCLKSITTSISFNPENLSTDCSNESFSELEARNLVSHVDVRRDADYNDDILQLTLVCQMISKLLFSALSTLDAFEGKLVADECEIHASAMKFANQIVLEFFDPTLSMFLRVTDCQARQCAMTVLLPSLLKAVNMIPMPQCLSRATVMQKLWQCCKKLFHRESLYRQDAYTILSLFGSGMLSSSDGNMADVNFFDVRSDKEFWEELRTGLVDEEISTRKKALHILKLAIERRPFLSKSNGFITTEENSSTCRSPQKISENRHDKTVIYKTKRDRWADIEAKSLGVGTVAKSGEKCPDYWQRWESFVLLYEMLDEYGTHLVEAAWSHQISLLVNITEEDTTFGNQFGWNHQSEIGAVDVLFWWTTVLWQRGFDHGNPQVRQLILQSFLEIDWKSFKNLETVLPKCFVLGPFLKALNDPVHHKDFSLQGVYSSRTSIGAGKFIQHYSFSLGLSDLKSFTRELASHAKYESLGRAGLMTLAHCIEEATGGVRFINGDHCKNTSSRFSEGLAYEKISAVESSEGNGNLELLESLQFIVDGSKKHFNQKYRLQVCEHCLVAVSSLMMIYEVPFVKLLSFLYAFPKEIIIYGGPLHTKVSQWLNLHDIYCPRENPIKHQEWISNNLSMYVESFVKVPRADTCFSFDDEQLNSWHIEAEKWARLLCLGVLQKSNLIQILNVLENHTRLINQQPYVSKHMSEKLLVLLSVLMDECCQCHKSLSIVMQGNETQSTIKGSYPEFDRILSMLEAVSNVVSVMEDLCLYAETAMKVFFSYQFGNDKLPASVSGKLGGPSQRRLPSSATSLVLRAVVALNTISACILWCNRMADAKIPSCVISLLWKFSWAIVNSSFPKNEIEAEIRLGAYEALASVSKAVSVVTHFSSFDLISKVLRSEDIYPEEIINKLVASFLDNVNEILQSGHLARSRSAKLLWFKWRCLDSFLSIHAMSPSCLTEEHSGGKSAVGDSILERVMYDATESLQCADEESFLEIMKCVRWVMNWDLLSRLSSDISLHSQKKLQIMWSLVQSSWAASCDCNKRRVAPIAALLSAIFHRSIFNDSCMHNDGGDDQGPLKWFLGKLLEQGSRSPRTMRLTAMHLTGMWLLYPAVIKYYMKELKLLSLHGSVAIDEDLDVELLESQVSAKEYWTLVQSSDMELTEAFLNTEMYARISVAILFHQLAHLVESTQLEECHIKNRQDAFAAGKAFLLELLDSVVSDTDLNKELYKKSSAIHRRKTRAWQMLCILTRFADQDSLNKILPAMHNVLYRNNLPAVRQFIEIFAMNIYLRFPLLIIDQMIPVLSDFNLKPQALASYVFIAVHVLMNVSTAELQFQLLEQLLPAVIPSLTSHHHSLRCFTQILVYRVLCKFLNTSEASAVLMPDKVPLEKKCLESIKEYLETNIDCKRLRSSVEKHVNLFEPVALTTPRGIFRLKDRDAEQDIPFESVPMSIVEHITQFLNDVRDNLRSSMAKDAAILKRQDFEDANGGKDKISASVQQKYSKPEIIADDDSLIAISEITEKMDKSLDFQKKFFSHKFEEINSHINIKSLMDHLSDSEIENELIMRTLESRLKDAEKNLGKRKNLIVVASLLGRIPNLAGLARTCEVFKAETLVISDAGIIQDKQFQLISVTAEKWIPIQEVPESNLKEFLNSKKISGYSILGLEQTTNSIPLDKYQFPEKSVLVLGKEKEGIPVDIIHLLDACVEIPQYGVIRSLNVHVSGAIAVWEYTRQHSQ